MLVYASMLALAVFKLGFHLLNIIVFSEFLPFGYTATSTLH